MAGARRLPDRGQFIPADAAVGLTRVIAVAWDLNANATSAALVAAAQQGSRLVVRHVNRPYLCLDPRGALMLISFGLPVILAAATIYPIRVYSKDPGPARCRRLLRQHSGWR